MPVPARGKKKGGEGGKGLKGGELLAFDIDPLKLW